MMLPENLEYVVEHAVPWIQSSREMHSPIFACVHESVRSRLISFPCVICETYEGVDNMDNLHIWAMC